MLVVSCLQRVGRCSKLVPLDTSIFNTREQHLYEELRSLGGTARFLVYGQEIFATLLLRPVSGSEKQHTILLYAACTISPEPSGGGMRVTNADLLHFDRIFIPQEGAYDLVSLLRATCTKQSATLTEYIQRRNAANIGLQAERSRVLAEIKHSPQRDVIIARIDAAYRDRTILNERDVVVQKIISIMLKHRLPAR